MSDNDRRFVLNLTDAQKAKVLALASGLVTGVGWETEDVLKGLRSALHRTGVGVLSKGEVTDLHMAEVLEEVESVWGPGSALGNNLADEILDIIGGHVEVIENRTPSRKDKEFWSVPNLWMIALDETEYGNFGAQPESEWIEDLGPYWIHGIYLVDESRVTHICSFQASQYCWYVDTNITFARQLASSEERTDEEREDFRRAQHWVDDYQQESGAEIEYSDYYSGGIISRVPDRLKKHLGAPVGRWSRMDGETDDEKYQTWMEELSHVLYDELWIGIREHIIDVLSEGANHFDWIQHRQEHGRG